MQKHFEEPSSKNKRGLRATAFPAFTWPNNRSGVKKCEVSLGCLFGGQVVSNTRDCPRQSVHERYSYDKRTPSTDDICPCALSFAPSASLVLSVTSQRDRGIGYSTVTRRRSAGAVSVEAFHIFSFIYRYQIKMAPHTHTHTKTNKRVLCLVYWLSRDTDDASTVSNSGPIEIR